jgi:hypothetical protein
MGLTITVIASSPVLSLESVAVTVITFSPLANPMPDIVHVMVPEAEPEVGEHVEQAQATLETVTLSDAVPPRLIVSVAPLSYVALDVGEVIVQVGSVVSSAPLPISIS